MILPGSLNRSTKPVTCQTLQILDLEGNLVDDLDEVTSLEVGYGKRMLIKQKSVDQLRYYETWDVLILTNWCRISSLNSPNLKWWSLARNACNEVWDYIVKSCRNISKWCMQWSILFQFVACLRSSVTKTMGRCVVTFHSCQYFQRQATFFVGCNYYDNLRQSSAIDHTTKILTLYETQWIDSQPYRKANVTQWINGEPYPKTYDISY